MDARGWEMDITPVDWAAGFIVEATCNGMKHCAGSIKHVQNPQKPIRMSEVMTMLREMGFVVEDTGLPVKEWIGQVELKAGESDICAKCAIAMESFGEYFAMGGKERFEGTDLTKFSKKRIRSEGGDDVEGQCPRIDKEYLRKALSRQGVSPPH